MPQTRVNAVLLLSPAAVTWSFPGSSRTTTGWGAGSGWLSTLHTEEHAGIFSDQIKVWKPIKGHFITGLQSRDPNRRVKPHHRLHRFLTLLTSCFFSFNSKKKKKKGEDIMGFNLHLTLLNTDYTVSWALKSLCCTWRNHLQRVAVYLIHFF